MAVQDKHTRIFPAVAAGICLLFFAFGLLAPRSADAAIPKYLNFQGKLTAVSGGTNVADGTYAMQFKIYDASTSGSLLWTETFDQPSGACAKVQVTSGVFSVKLGTCNALTIDVTGGSLYLSVNFAPTGTSYDGEMSPRKQLVASAFAFNANNLVGDGKIDITNTSSTQLAVKYDASNKLELSVASNGTSTFTASGTTARFAFSGGNLGVGDTTPAALFTVGNGDLFQVNSSGAIAAAAGITSSGAINFSGLSTNGVVYTSGGTGTLNAEAQLSVTRGGTGASSSQGAINAISQLTTNGDLLYHNGTNSTRLARGNDGECLTSTTTTIQWGSCGTGGASSLQSSYGADSDGSNATISLTTADDSIIITNPSSNGTDSAFTLQIDQANTTAAVLGLDIVQRSNAANAVNITANSIDSEAGLTITADALTSGNGLVLASSSTAFTGALAKLTLSGSNSANTGSVLRLESTGTASATTGLYIDHRATGAGNLALRIDDVSGDTTPLIVDGDGRLGIGTTSITGTTERLLQVGQPSNRGNAAVYGEIVTKGLKQIQALANIKDTFIYDTSLDSDGGRWIDWADTEKQSWFTETLDDSPSTPCDISSMDRCYSDAFPRKAILVVTTNSLYIFDATNGNMWMKFGQNAAGWALGVDTNNDPSSVTAKNGVIYVGMNGSSAAGLFAIDFVNDRMWNFDDTDRSGSDLGIGSRNSAIVYNSDNNTNFDLATTGTIAGWKTINDVWVDVVQNSQTAISTTQAPSNATTVVGLATDSGLTVINLTTQKIRQYSDATDNDYNSVVVTKNARLYGLNSTLDQLELWINVDIDNVATRVNGTPDKVVDETTAPRLSKATPVVNVDAPDALDVIPRGSLADGGILSTATVPSNSDLVYVGTDQGLTEIHLANYTNATTFSGWSKFYTTTRQTALMPGTIRRMHTMDDASGNVTNAAQSSIMTAKGTPTYGVEGVRGKAMSFNGTSQYLCSDANSDGTCDNDTTDNINTGGFTITAWFKHAATASGVDTLFARCYNTTPAAATGCIAAAMNASGQMVVTVDDDALWSVGAATNNDVTYTSTNSYADNQWHFFMLAKNTGNVAPVVMIDGQVISYATALNHTTFDNTQILGIGSDCSTGAACSTGGNFWDGAIDDFTYSACGSAACTADGLSTVSANAAAVGRLLYNDARPLVNKKVISVTDATTATSTTIGDSGEAWIPNEFAGQIVTLTGNTGAGQTRRIVSNTTTTLTVSPAFTTTPDTSTDFKIDPEALVGSSNNVLAIGVTKDVSIGESRMMCVGTNNTTDGGAVTCYNHQAGPNLIADTYHADAKYLDDSGTEWTGTDYDDIRSIDLTNRTIVISSMAHNWIETQDVRLGNALDYFQGKLTDIRSQMLTMGSSTLAGQIGLGVGLVGGADLAEYYYSRDRLENGDVVVIDRAGNGDDVLRSQKAYSGGLIGVVSTEPGLVLGLRAEDGYAIALTGRIPVKFSYENGPVKAGDYLTSASIPGFAMRATGAGPTIGKALTDSPSFADAAECFVPETDAAGTLGRCGVVSVFVEHGNFSGLPIEQLMQEMEVSVTSNGALIEGSLDGLVENESSLLTEVGLESAGEESLTTEEKILVFLKHIKESKQQAKQGVSAELFTDRVSAAFAIVTPQVTTAGLSVETIGKLGGSIDMLGDVTFFGRPYLNSDTAGFAVIKKGKTSVEVTFEKEYLEQPVVQASVTLELDQAVVASDDAEKIAQLQREQDVRVGELFGQGIQTLVTRKSAKGFTIVVNKPAPQDVTFSWIAFAVKNPKLFGADENADGIQAQEVPAGTVAGTDTSVPAHTDENEQAVTLAPQADAHPEEDSTAAPEQQENKPDSADNAAPAEIVPPPVEDNGNPAPEPESNQSE